mgnify:FL=1|jgi:hypothetical protein|tara:strand:+ start:399 stop:575 length:177 start_codon:yes stop_codon:yes gene_type:complete
MIRRTIKKEVDLSKSTTGCSPCFNEAKKIQRKIGDRKVTEIKLNEIKKIVSSLFDEKN